VVKIDSKMILPFRYSKFVTQSVPNSYCFLTFKIMYVSTIVSLIVNYLPTPKNIYRFEKHPFTCSGDVKELVSCRVLQWIVDVRERVDLKRPLTESFHPWKQLALDAAFRQNLSVEELGHRIVVGVVVLLTLSRVVTTATATASQIFFLAVLFLSLGKINDLRN